MPGLLSEEGTLAEEVGLEQAVHSLHSLWCGLVHHCLPLLNDKELIPSLSLPTRSGTLCQALLAVQSMCLRCVHRLKNETDARRALMQAILMSRSRPICSRPLSLPTQAKAPQ